MYMVQFMLYERTLTFIPSREEDEKTLKELGIRPKGRFAKQIGKPTTFDLGQYEEILAEISEYGMGVEMEEWREEDIMNACLRRLRSYEPGRLNDLKDPLRRLLLMTRKELTK